jgi:hypothetical protein
MFPEGDGARAGPDFFAAFFAEATLLLYGARLFASGTNCRTRQTLPHDRTAIAIRFLEMPRKSAKALGTPLANSSSAPEHFARTA